MQDHPREPAAGARPSPLTNPLLWVVLLIVLLVPLMLIPLRRGGGVALPDYGAVPAFRLIDANADVTTLADLEGRVWIADFFFTRCVSICPLLTQAMLRLQGRLARAGVRDVHLVGFSVDPEFDNPQRLKAYGEAHGVDSGRWTMLTGDRGAMRKLIEDGFLLGLGPSVPLGENLIDISHSGRFVLVDRAGRIRGYYEIDAESQNRLYNDALRLLND